MLVFRRKWVTELAVKRLVYYFSLRKLDQLHQDASQAPDIDSLVILRLKDY